MHVSFAIRPASVFVQHMLASAGTPRITAGADFACRSVNSEPRVVLGPEFHRDLEVWRSFVAEGLYARRGCVLAPMYHLLERPARRTVFSDASKAAIRGFCLETGIYWRYEPYPAEQSCFCGSSKTVEGVNDISINVLELLGMVVSARVLVSRCAERPSATGDCVLLRGDNKDAVAWVPLCRGGKEPRSGALMRLPGALELSSGWHFDAKYVQGVFNVSADGISRWDRNRVLHNLQSVRPNVPWQAQDLEVGGRTLCTSELTSTSCAMQLRSYLNRLIWGTLAPG